MARQEGIILLTGPIGNLSFYKSQDGHLVRKKSGVSRDRIFSDPAYTRTRENIAEFRRAILATKLLRTAFGSLLRSAVDVRMSSRLTGAMVKVIQGDEINPRGQRNVTNGDAALLEGFEFNKNTKFATTFSAPFTASIDRSTNTLTVDVPSFRPVNMISVPEGATHFRLKMGAAAIDFEGNDYSVTTLQSADLEISQEVQAPLHFSLRVMPASVHPLFIVFGIEFLQSGNGTLFPLKNSASHAMAIVKVDGTASDEEHVVASVSKEGYGLKNQKWISQRPMIRFKDSKCLIKADNLPGLHRPYLLRLPRNTTLLLRTTRSFALRLPQFSRAAQDRRFQRGDACNRVATNHVCPEPRSP